MIRLPFILLFTILQATRLFAQGDSLVFTNADFMARVKADHPVSRQAALLRQEGDATVLKARGAFDPKAGTELDQKYFDGKTYYDQLSAGLKIPTWFGVELKAGFEQNTGVYLDSEDLTPAAGLWYAGVSLPLAQGLVIDERRKTLRQAQIYRQSTAAEQQLQLNELLYSAAQAYWNWHQAWNNNNVYSAALTVARQRFEGIKRSAAAGDRPYIDTLEAGIQVQDRQLMLQQASLELLQRKLELENFLWTPKNEPLELSNSVTPERITGVTALPVINTLIRQQLDSICGVHPAVLLYNYKIDGLVLEERFKRDKLKPVINLNYNPLTNAGEAIAAYNPTNYKWGVSVGMPLLLRKERGDLALTRLKISDTRYDLQYKQLELRNKIEFQLNAIQVTRDQVALYSRTVLDYEKLVAAERRMFDIGESSLFLVNAREQSYFNAMLKLNDLVAKNNKAYAGSLYAAGILANQ